MRPATRPLYRVRQFIQHVTARYSSIDNDFVQGLLTPTEFSLFQKLPIFEKRHAVDVAMYFDRYRAQFPDEQIELLQKVGLLHDIGKAELPLNPVEKSIFVILRVVAPRFVEQLADSGQSPKARIFLRHNEIGAKLLEKICSNPQIIRAVAGYYPGAARNDINQILSEADEFIL